MCMTASGRMGKSRQLWGRIDEFVFLLPDVHHLNIILYDIIWPCINYTVVFDGSSSRVRFFSHSDPIVFITLAHKHTHTQKCFLDMTEPKANRFAATLLVPSMSLSSLLAGQIHPSRLGCSFINQLVSQTIVHSLICSPSNPLEHRALRSAGLTFPRQFLNCLRPGRIISSFTLPSRECHTQIG